MKLVVLALGLLGCQRTEQSACAELQQTSPPGVVLATDEPRCEQLLEFARRVPGAYDMSFEQWLSAVAGQGGVLVHKTVSALTEGTIPPTSFGPIPPAPPCAPGVKLDTATWSRSALALILGQDSQTMYTSFELRIEATTATLRVLQDFDCDQQHGLLEVVGEFQVGVSLYSGGWRLVRSSEPPVDE